MTRSNRNTETMTHYQLVKENQPKPIYYKGTETKKMARPCMRCGEVVQGTLASLERHVAANHPTIIEGFDYTNQAWIKDGVYVRCGHPLSYDEAQVVIDLWEDRLEREGKEVIKLEFPNEMSKRVGLLPGWSYMTQEHYQLYLDRDADYHCSCYGKLHAGEPPAVGAEIH